MEIPVLTRFIEGLKLFFASKRLKWLTLIFFIGALLIYTMERLIFFLPATVNLAIGVAAVFPFFWMLVTIIAILGLQRFIASEESYKQSVIYTIIWSVVSVVLFIISFIFAWGILLTTVFIGFFVWIAFQAYFSTRTSLGFATGVQVEHRSKALTFLFGIANFMNYVIIVGAAILTVILYLPATPSPVAVGGAIVGIAIAGMFNLLNGIIIAAERNRQTADNLSLLGLFIALYSGYFIYNVLKPVDLGIDIVGILITIFFLLYTMSGVGRSLASRADLETRFKLSKELAATFTFFIASCYVFVDVLFTFLVNNPAEIAPVSDIVKLWLFPLVALVMEIRFIWRSRKATEVPETPEELPVVPVEETVYDEDGEVVEPITPEVEEVPSEIEDLEEVTEEPVVEEEPPSDDADIDEPVMDEPEEDGME